MDESQIANEVKLITDYEDLDVWARQRGLTNHPAFTNRHLDLFIQNHISDNTHQQSDTANIDQLISDLTDDSHTSEHSCVINHPDVSNTQLDLFIEKHGLSTTLQPLDQLCDWTDDSHTSEHSPVDTLPATPEDLEISNSVGLFTNYEELERWSILHGLCEHPSVISRHFDLLQENTPDTPCKDTGHVTGQKRKNLHALQGEGSKSSEVKFLYIYDKFRLNYIHIIYKYKIINIYYIAAIFNYSAEPFKTIEVG